MTKVILFDADGVMTMQQPPFSVQYTNQFGLDLSDFTPFFESEWKDYVTGRKDLREHIEANPGFWQWEGTPDELIEYWLHLDDVRNNDMIDLVKKIRASGTPCYLATEQEHNRGNYMKETMFKDLFDGYFVTAEIGYKKSDHRFFESIYEKLTVVHHDLQCNNILFFDDDQPKVDAAIKVGIDAVLFNSIDSVTDKLSEEKIVF